MPAPSSMSTPFTTAETIMYKKAEHGLFQPGISGFCQRFSTYDTLEDTPRDVRVQVFCSGRRGDSLTLHG